jgi:acetyl/propionyl-CoA carboxylase alpha subunit
MSHFRLRIGEEERAFDVIRQGDTLHVVGDDRETVEARVLYRDGGELLLEIQQPGPVRRLRIAGARRGDRRLLWVDGRSLTAERAHRAAAGRGADAGSLSSSIPAVVSQLLVAPGDVVAEGDKLILLESMKMVIPIVAPLGGRVAAIHCAPGDAVPAGVPLVEIETE